MYTRITPSKNGRDAIQYARGNKEEKGHNGKEKRNLLVGSVNMLPDETISYEDQMQLFWNKASARHEVQVRRIVGSFSEKELDPKDPNSPHKALQMASEFITEYYPDRQAAIFIQNDGVGGKLHFHAIVNDCDMISAKGCNVQQQKSWYVEKNFDEIAQQYFTLDMDKHDAADKTTQHERNMRQKNADGENNYIWKDDLKERIASAMSEASDRDDFLSKLTAHGVEGEYRTSKKVGDYIIYELVDTSGFDDKIPSNLKSKSYKLGSDYGLEALDEHIAKKKSATFTPTPYYSARSEKPKRQKTAEELKREQEETARMQEESNKFYDWCEKNGIDAVKFADDDAYYEKARKKYDAWLQNPPTEPQIAPMSRSKLVSNRKRPAKPETPVAPSAPAPEQTKDEQSEILRARNFELQQMLIEEGKRLSDEEKAAMREREEIICKNNYE